MEMRFMYSPAFVAEVTSRNVVRVWLEHPGSDHIDYHRKWTIQVDLSKTPSSNCKPEHIEVDDYFNHVDPRRRGFSSLGPLTAQMHTAMGLYLSLDLIKARAVPGTPGAWSENERTTLIRAGLLPPKGQEALVGRPYERQSLLLRDLHRQDVRFHGFHQCAAFNDLPGRRLLISVAHAYASEERRAPRPVIVSAEDVFGMDLDGLSQVGEAGQQIFLERSVASAAALDIPKRPFGSGDGRLTAKVVTKEVPDPRSGGPLNVFGLDATDEVKTIQRKLDKNFMQIGRGDLEKQLEVQAKLKKTFTSLDLIGHARGNGVMRINDLQLTATVMTKLFDARVVQHLKQLKIKQVRLLGCRTACGEAGREALRAIAIAVGVGIEVRGTRGDVFAVHYGAPARASKKRAPKGRPPSGDFGGFEEDRLLCGLDMLVNDAPADEDLPYVEEADEDEEGDAVGKRRVNPDAADDDFTVDQLPLATESSSNATRRHAWSNPTEEEFASFVSLLDPEAEGSPIDQAEWEIFVVDGETVHAFDLVKAAKGYKVRLNYSDEWYEYSIDVKQLRELIGLPA